MPRPCKTETFSLFYFYTFQDGKHGLVAMKTTDSQKTNSGRVVGRIVVTF
jgi:hypothetical protein